MINKITGFCDVDGVINGVATLDKTHYKSFAEWKLVEVNGYTITYAPEVVDFLNNLGDRINLKMLTTWKYDSMTKLAPAIGLRTDLEVVDVPGSWSSIPMSISRENRWWKLNAILDHINSPDATDFIWADDDIGSYTRNYVKRMAEFEGLESLIITPHTGVALTREHLNRIEAFVEAFEKRNANLR